MESCKNGKNAADILGNTQRRKRKKNLSIVAVAENGEGFSLFLQRIKDGALKEICFRIPDRCNGKDRSISPEFLKKFSNAIEDFSKKDIVFATIFLTDGTPPDCLVDLEKEEGISPSAASKNSIFKDVSDEDAKIIFSESSPEKYIENTLEKYIENNYENTFFGIDRRTLFAKLYKGSISFKKAMVIRISRDVGEVFFCIGERIVSTDCAKLSKDSLSEIDNAVATIINSPKIAVYSEDFRPDTVFINIPSLSERETFRITCEFKNSDLYKNTNVLFSNTDQKALALYGIKTLRTAFRKAFANKKERAEELLGR